MLCKNLWNEDVQNSEANLKLLLIADVHAQVIQGVQSLHSDIRFRVRKEAGDDVKTSKFTKEILEGGKCLTRNMSECVLVTGTRGSVPKRSMETDHHKTTTNVILSTAENNNAIVIR